MMEVQFGPNSVDEPNLLYKLQRKIKVFNTNNPLPNRGYNLVASTSKYGIVFITSPEGTLSVYYLQQLIDKECEPQHMSVRLPENPTHIGVSCDQELLAVTGGQLLCVYKITNFQNQNASPSVTIKCDVNPSTFVSALQWNPCVPDTLAIAFFDGTLLVSQVSSGQIKKVPSKARCICWSPKGKQLVTGNNDGTLSQYKPDLTPAKMIPPPKIFEGSPTEALAIYWISTFQFAVVYKNATDNSRPAVTIVNTPKAGQPSCFNYEDICYSMGSNRPWYYYLLGLAQWNMILSSSSNSMEIATLGSADGANWVQWCQTDEARPELPLTDKKQENYPVGICIDTCAIHRLPWGENDTLPHMPLMHVVSQSGLLTIFNIINLNNDAPQLCTPPQLLTLPAAAMTSEIPGEAPPQAIPAQVAAPVAQPKIQPVQQASQPQAVQAAFAAPTSTFAAPTSTFAAPTSTFAAPTRTFAAPTSHFASPTNQFGAMTTNAYAKPLGSQQPQISQGFETAKVPQVTEVKPVISVPQPQTHSPVAQATPQPAAAKAQPSPQAQEVNAALKAEQEKMNRLKADKELRSMLIKEVNDFQMELHKFVVKTRETQIKLQNELNSINCNMGFHSLNAEQLKKECSMEELRAAIVELKLELVRACAVVAEARTHAEAKDLHQWTQADPLTTKRVASVKKLAYYVQSQLEQAHKALDYKWHEMAATDPQFNKPGHRMIRPILDDVYQPLVKQQEILSRQQAVLRTLRSTLKECDAAPMFKSTTLLRSTPFRSKDPLSKLTKNILNMSIEPTNVKEPLLTPHKLDALRDMLSNHKPVKIKPVNVELRQRLAAMRLSYEKSVKEKADQPAQPVTVKSEPVVSEPVRAVKPTPTDNIPKPEPKPDLIAKQMPISVPSFTPVNNLKPMPGLTNVARTLFSDEPKQEPAKPIQPQKPQIQPVTVKPQHSTTGFAPPTSLTVTANTRSILKDMLQNKQANASVSTSAAPSSNASSSDIASPSVKPVVVAEAKNEANTFMGQKICSPTAFSFSSSPAQSASFTSKPISDINNMFSKFTPQTFSTENLNLNLKPQPSQTKPKSDETGEPESSESAKQMEKSKEEKPLTNLFAMKTSTPLASSSQNVPDVLKSNFTIVKPESKTVKPVEKAPEKSKENVAEKSGDSMPPLVQKLTTDERKDNGSNLFTTSAANKSGVNLIAQRVVTSVGSATMSNDSQKIPQAKNENKDETPKLTEKSESSTNSSASSIFAAANAATPTESKSSIFGTSPPVSPTSSQGPFFGSLTSSQPASPSAESATNKEAVFAPTTSASFVFSTVAAQPAPFVKTTSPASIFTSTAFTSTASTASSVFGTSTQGSIFGTGATTTQSSTSSVFATTTTQSVFNGAAAAAKPSVFSTPTPASPSSVFGTSTATVFGSPAASVFAATTVQAPAFGSTTTPPAFGSATTTTPSVFGTPTTTSQPVFGATATTTQSIFGATSATTQSPVFGGTTSTTESVFSGATATTRPSIFDSVFVSPTPTTQASIFGASVFGSATPSTQASVFGSPVQTTQPSVFGTPTQTTQASVFGTPPATTAQSGSLFGGGEANLFAAASISTTSASSSSGGNIFGGGSTGSAFGGSSTNVFGGKSTFSQSNPTAASIFGGAASTFGQKPAPANNFWGSGTASAGSGFGSTGFGQPATTQSSTLFGGGTGGSFSAPSGGTAFGTPQQSSVFGAQQQTGSAFGGSPVFGSKPAFGQSASFGSPTSGGGFGSSFGGFNKSPGGGFGAPASFGGGTAFGGSAFGNTSPGKMFGGGTAAPAFATPTQSNATFENLATQNTLTFGNLAQQSGQPSPQAPTFNTSPSFTGWRG